MRPMNGRVTGGLLYIMGRGALHIVVFSPLTGPAGRRMIAWAVTARFASARFRLLNNDFVEFREIFVRRNGFVPGSIDTGQ